MKSILSLCIFTLFIGECIATQPGPKYGILPFETENITQETLGLIPDQFNKGLATTVNGSINNLKIPLDNKQLNVYLIEDKPISRTDVEMPVVSFDDEYKNTLYADLKALSANYDGLIFGHLEEELAGNGSLLLIMRVYNKKDGHIESFEADAIDLGDVKNKKQMTAQLGKRIIQLSKEVKRYIVEPPVSVGSGGDAPEDNEDNVAPDDSDDVATDNDVENLLPIDVDSLLPSTKVDSTNKAKTTSMSLKDVYKMLYEQRFYVVVPESRKGSKHTTARCEAARELGIDKWEFYYSFEKVKRTNVHATQKSCTEKWVVSEPVPGTKGKLYNLCYDIRYLYSSRYVPDEKRDKVRCRANGTYRWPEGRKTSMLTYPQAKKEIEKLRQETSNPRWKIPSIEELYVLTDGHLPYPNSNNTWERDKVNVIWSSTSLPSQPNRKWVIQASINFNWWKKYRPKLWDSSHSNLQGGYIDTAILFPVYTCD